MILVTLRCSGIVRNTAQGISCLRGNHYSTHCYVGVKNARKVSSTSSTCLHCDVFRHKIDIRRCWAKLVLAGAVCFANPQADFDKCWETNLECGRWAGHVSALMTFRCHISASLLQKCSSLRSFCRRIQLDKFCHVADSYPRTF